MAWFVPLIGTALNFLGKGVSNWAASRQRVKEAKTNAKIALIEQKTKMIADADVESIRAQRYSIKDEIVLICIMAPYVGAFIPGAQPYIEKGFQILAGLPHWYQVAIIGIIISVMGLRFMMGRFFKR